MNLSTVRLLTSPSWFQVQCTERIKKHCNHVIQRVFCFPDVYSYGSRVLLDRLYSTLQCSRHSSAQSRRCTSGSLNLRYLWIMRDFPYSLIKEQPILVRDPLYRETQLSPKNCFSPCFSLTYSMGIRLRSVTTWGTRRIGAHSGQVALVCHGNNFGYSWLTELGILQGRKLH